MKYIFIALCYIYWYPLGIILYSAFLWLYWLLALLWNFELPEWDRVSNNWMSCWEFHEMKSDKSYKETFHRLIRMQFWK
jgi:hypothetical protein